MSQPSSTSFTAATIAAITIITVSQVVQAQAAAPPIATDRPGLGYSPAVVPQGAVQLEIGAPSIATGAAGGVDSRLTNFPVAVRVGVTPRLELRVGGTTYNIARAEVAGVTGTERGFGGVEVGAKLALAGGSRGVSLAVIPSVVLPVGDDAFDATARRIHCRARPASR